MYFIVNTCLNTILQVSQIRVSHKQIFRGYFYFYFFLIECKLQLPTVKKNEASYLENLYSVEHEGVDTAHLLEKHES